MTWFKVDDQLHSHPKATAASLAALGLWTVAGSWCGNHHTDGSIPDHMVSSLSRGQTSLAEELVAVGLWERAKGGYRFHEWAADSDGTPRNPTRKEATAGRKKMSSGGNLGNHRRWHVDKKRVEPGCRYCLSTDGGRVPDRSGRTRPDGLPDTRPDTYPIPDSESGGGKPDPRNTGSDLGKHRVPDRVLIGVPESPPTPPDPGPGPSLVVTDPHLSPSVPREDDDLDLKIVELVAELTGHTLATEHATTIRRRILDGRQVKNPAAYVATAIRADPAAWLPASRDLAYRPAAEVLRPAGKCEHGAPTGVGEVVSPHCALCRFKIPERQVS